MRAAGSPIPIRGRVPALAAGFAVSVAVHGALLTGLALTPLGGAETTRPSIEYASGESVRVRLAARPPGSRAERSGERREPDRLEPTRVRPARPPLATSDAPPAPAATRDVSPSGVVEESGSVRASATEAEPADTGAPSPAAAPPVRALATELAALPETPRGGPVSSRSQAGVHRGVEALDLPQPAYPARSVRLGHEGTVVVEVRVRADGSVASVRVRSGSGHRLLDEAAVEAARRGRFRPATRGGEAVESVAVVPFEFRLTGGR